MVQIDAPANPILTAGQSYAFQASDLSIVSQAAADFSIGTVTHLGNPYGAVLSAAGGVFQCGLYAASPTPTLDGGSTGLRLFQYGVLLGDIDPDLSALGGAATLPVTSAAAQVSETLVSLPGRVSAGDRAAWNIFGAFLVGFGTDSVDLSSVLGFPLMAVWQIG